MEQLKVGTNDLPSAVKKKVIAAAALVSSTEAFSTVGLALQLEVPTVAAANIPDQKVGEECWNSDLDGRLETIATSVHLKVVAACIHLEAEVATTSEATRLRETLPTTSQVFGPYENPVT
jgi:ribosome-binding ATPase YchF (GTP1/OBG family)